MYGEIICFATICNRFFYKYSDIYPYARISNYEEKEMQLCSTLAETANVLVKMMAGDVTDVCDLTAGE